MTGSHRPPVSQRHQKLAVGGDLKYAVASNLTLNATVNPDFGQVEADPSELNLSAFETFFSERRPFFVAGAGQFDFTVNCFAVVDCQTGEGLFYSRRIGRSPLARRPLRRCFLTDLHQDSRRRQADRSPPGGLSVGFLDAVTDRVGGVAQRTIEPTDQLRRASGQPGLRRRQGQRRIDAHRGEPLDRSVDRGLHAPERLQWRPRCAAPLSDSSSSPGH